MNDVATKDVPEVLVIQHSYACSADALFDAWLDPATVREFMCPGSGHIGKLEWPAKAGGEFLIEMIADGVSRPHTGRFMEITRPRRISFTWNSHAAVDSMVTLEFAETETKGRSLLTLTHERLASGMIEGHRKGWTSIFGEAGGASC